VSSSSSSVAHSTRSATTIVTRRLPAVPLSSGATRSSRRHAKSPTTKPRRPILNYGSRCHSFGIGVVGELTCWRLLLCTVVYWLFSCSLYSQTRLSGWHWDLIMSIHLGRLSIYPCFITYVVSKLDQTNDIRLSGIHLWRCDCTCNVCTVCYRSHIQGGSKK